jgi:hypothetical protein
MVAFWVCVGFRKPRNTSSSGVSSDTSSTPRGNTSGDAPNTKEKENMHDSPTEDGCEISWDTSSTLCDVENIKENGHHALTEVDTENPNGEEGECNDLTDDGSSTTSIGSGSDEEEGECWVSDEEG